jgi:phosphotransferase system  glucose/maltose/N-acetylglucosamine-specific IIC component
MIGHIFFGLAVLILLYPMIYFFIDYKDCNKLEKNLEEYEKKNGKTNL